MPAEDLSIELNEGGPNWHFQPGSVISGAMIVKVQWAKKYDKIVVRLRGKADVYWEVVHSGNRHYGGGGTSKYSASEEYIHEDLVVWNRADTSDGTFPAGTTSLPFQFTLPPSLPSSYSSEPANITYTVEGVIHPTFNDYRRLPKVQYRFNVYELTPPNPETSTRPLSVKKFKRVSTLGFNPGVIKATVNVPCTGINVGDTLPVTVHVENRSGRRVTIKGQMGELLTYHGYLDGNSRNPKEARGLYSQLQECTASIEPHASRYISFNVTVTHTAVKLSRIIQTKLMVRVTTVIPRSSNMDVNIPLSVANERPRVAVQ